MSSSQMRTNGCTRLPVCLPGVARLQPHSPRGDLCRSPVLPLPQGGLPLGPHGVLSLAHVVKRPPCCAYSYLDTIERAISEGDILLIENIGETVDPVLDPLLGRNTIKKGK